MPQAPSTLPSRDDDAWSATRHGAYSARGFHYQDVVGAWVSAQMLTGTIDADRLVPEGFEDLSLEGKAPLQIQVKSRLERRGPFPSNEAAEWVQSMLAKWAQRPGQLVLVTERPIDGHIPTGLLSSLGLASSDDALSKALVSQGVDAASLGRVSTLTLPWADAHHVAVDHVTDSLAVAPAVGSLIALKLRDEVARCVDANAQANRFADRLGIFPADIRRAAIAVAGAVDHSRLNDVLSSGVCDLLDLDTPLDEASIYFEGVSAQPGHIAAGLATARPTETARVITGLESRRAALISGPSGVGKSTVMWASAYSMRDILWFRVRRLGATDAAAIARFTREQLPGSASPIGFVVDGVGTGSLLEWDELVRQLASIPHVYLLGSCRHEDLVALSTLAECELTEVALDEAIATRIHRELLVRGRTTTPHWKEAFDAADGLTMEFTHLLTRGRRMASVLADQVNRYVQEANSGVLRVLGLSAVAHHWGAGLRVDQLADPTTDDATLRRILTQLHKEHLVVVQDGTVTGLHPLRSKVVASLVHAVPPPTLDSSFERVVALVDARGLRPIIANALAETLDLRPVAIKALVDRTVREPTLEVITNSLNGLQLAELHQLVSQMDKICADSGVTLSDRAVCMQMSLIDMAELLGSFKPEIATAVQRIRSLDVDSAPMREEYLGALGWSLLRSAAASADHLNSLTEFAGLVPASVDITEVVDPTSVRRLGEASPLPAIAEFLRTVEDNSPKRVRPYIRGFGGRRATLKRILDADPSITLLPVPTGGPCSAHFLHLPEAKDDEDSRMHAVELAKLLLAIHPKCQNADVRLVAPGEHPIVIGDYEHSGSGLDRRYVHSAAEIRRNQLLMIIGTYLAGQPTGTERASAATRIVTQLAAVTSSMATLFVGGRLTAEEIAAAELTRQFVAEAAKGLLPPSSPNVLARDGQLTFIGESQPTQNDALSSLVDGILRPLWSGLTSDRPNWYGLTHQLHGLLEHAREVRRREPWALLGLADAPKSIDELAQTLEGLLVITHALAEEALTVQAMRSVGGPARGRVARTAEYCTKRASRHRAEQVDAIRRHIAAIGPRVVSHIQPWAPTKDGTGHVRFDVAVTDPLAWLSLWDELTVALADVPVAHWTTTTLVPVLNGQALPQLSLRWNGSLSLAHDVISDCWPDVVFAACRTPLTDALDLASSSLQSISSINYLRFVRDNPGLLTDGMGRARERLATAAAALGLGTEEVPTAIQAFIREQTDNVDQESSGSVQPGTLAEALALGAMGHRDGIFQAWTECRIAALDWDINPAGAAEALASPRLLGVGRFIWQSRLDGNFTTVPDVSSLLPITPSELLALQQSKPAHWESRSLLGTVIVGVQALADMIERYRQGASLNQRIRMDADESTEFARWALGQFNKACQVFTDALGEDEQARARGPRGFRGDVDRLAHIAYAVVDLLIALLSWFDVIRSVDTSDAGLSAFISALDRWAQKAVEDILAYVDGLRERWSIEMQAQLDPDDASGSSVIELTIQLIADPDAARAMSAAARAIGVDLEPTDAEPNSTAAFMRQGTPLIRPDRLPTLSTNPRR